MSLSSILTFPQILELNRNYISFYISVHNYYEKNIKVFLLIIFYNDCYYAINITNQICIEKSNTSIFLVLKMQISLMKDKDFTFFNLSPLINLFLSDSINEPIALRVGYKVFFQIYSG